MPSDSPPPKRPQFDSRVLTIQDLAEEAVKGVPKNVAEYFNCGADDMISLRDNARAFDRYKLRPRVLRNVAEVDTSTEIFGCKTSFPLGFAPAAAHCLAHPDGELATSRAAAAHNIAMVLSSFSTTSLEDVAAQGKGNPYGMHAMFLADRALLLQGIQRAEKAGYKALFVSVDLPAIGNRLSETRNGFTFPSQYGLPNLSVASGVQVSTDDFYYDPRISWEEAIPWLRQQTSLEIWLKGIYAPEDVQLAIDHGVDGIIISNHGGRQLDGVPATLDTLRICAPIAKQAQANNNDNNNRRNRSHRRGPKKFQIGLDGGIRRGSDLFKALALGADFCFVGRIPIWGLAYKGQAGVELAIRILFDEFKRTMMLMGCRSISDIGPECLSVLTESALLAKL